MAYNKGTLKSHLKCYHRDVFSDMERCLGEYILSEYYRLLSHMHELWSQVPWAQITVLLLTNRVTWGKSVASLCLSSLMCEMGSQGCREDSVNDLLHVKCLSLLLFL